MKLLFPLLALFGCSIATQSQTTNSFRLWPEAAPGALGTADKDIPTLTAYLPEPSKASGAAIVVCPGGGYGTLASHEGPDYARFFNELGIAGFVLKYRLGSAGYRHPVMLQDAARSVRLVRARAAEWNVDPKRIGIIGSSAGGHLASTLLTHFDDGKSDSTDPIERQSSRPDLGILCYPVVTMGQFTHEGSKHNLLGDKPSADLVSELSNELRVTKETPPCFVWHTADDRVVPVENSLQFADALRKAGVPFDLHIYQKGAHGLGLGAPYAADKSKRHPWIVDLVYWLKLQGFRKEAD